jgi:hypothetical protein
MEITMKTLFLLFMIVGTSISAFAQTPQSMAPQAIMEYRYWDLGASPKRDIFQYTLLKLILDKTVSEFGPYRLIKNEENFTPSRAAREIGRGEIINIEATPHRLTTGKMQEVAKNQFIMVGPPLIKGLLGYRRLIVREEDLVKFSNINSQQALRNLIAGQGRDWADIDIYRHNGYQVSAHATLNNLFAMLMAKRFDYIPLGVIEADNLLKQYSKESDHLAIVPSLLIYYPFPVHFNVSINRPELAARIEKGVMLTQADGSLNELFERFFGAEVELLKKQGSKVFYLNNPEITDPEELKATNQLPVKFIY